MPSRERADAAASRLVGRHDREEPDAEVPGALGRGEVEVAQVGQHPEHRGRRPRRAIELDPRALRQHAREVGGDAAAGDVAERVHAVAVVGDQAQQRTRVEARRLEQGLAPRRAEVGGVVAVLDAGAGDDVPHQRVAVGVQARARQRQHDVSAADAVGAEQAVGLDHAGRGAGDVVVVDAQEARVLGGLAADERGAGLGAAGARCRGRCRRCARGTTLPHAM